MYAQQQPSTALGRATSLHSPGEPASRMSQPASARSDLWSDIDDDADRGLVFVRHRRLSSTRSTSQGDTWPTQGIAPVAVEKDAQFAMIKLGSAASSRTVSFYEPHALRHGAGHASAHEGIDDAGEHGAAPEAMVVMDSTGILRDAGWERGPTGHTMVVNASRVRQASAAAGQPLLLLSHSELQAAGPQLHKLYSSDINSILEAAAAAARQRAQAEAQWLAADGNHSLREEDLAVIHADQETPFWTMQSSDDLVDSYQRTIGVQCDLPWAATESRSRPATPPLAPHQRSIAIECDILAADGRPGPAATEEAHQRSIGTQCSLPSSSQRSALSPGDSRGRHAPGISWTARLCRLMQTRKRSPAVAPEVDEETGASEHRITGQHVRHAWDV